MPFITKEGIKGKIFVPDEKTIIKKHPCKDCFYCQFCSDEKCSLCLKKKAADDTSKKNPELDK